MSRVLRLFAPKPAASAPQPVRESIGFVLEDGRRIDVLRVRDPRARRLRLSVDERGARRQRAALPFTEILPRGLEAGVIAGVQRLRFTEGDGAVRGQDQAAGQATPAGSRPATWYRN